MIDNIITSIEILTLAALGVHALTIQRTSASILLAIVLCLLSGLEMADRLSLQPTLAFTTYRRISLYLEATLAGSFLLLSILYGRSRPLASLSKVRLGLLATSALVPMAILLTVGTNLAYSPDILSEKVLFLGDEGYWFYIGIMAVLIVSLVNIEATLAASYGIARIRMKFEAIGIMSMLAVLIFYYSEGLLYRTINMNLLPIRSSIVIMAALLIGYSRIFRGSGERVFVSRHIFYRSVTLLVVGIYLIGLGLFGEGMRYFGVSFGRNLTIVIAFAGGALLLAVLFSEKVRRRAKVYISKHFYSHKHDYREEWIKFTSRLSSCATLADVQESVLSMFRETFGLAGASLYLLDRDEQYARSSALAMPEGPLRLRLSGELREYFVQRERVLDLTGREHRLSESEEILFRQAGSWLIVPLISNGRVEGLLVLRPQIVPENLIYEDYDLMKVLARQAAQAVTNLRLSEELLETRAMAAVARISSFVIHDLKNLTTSLSLVVDNAEEHIGNPDFQQDAIKTIKNTLAKMKALTQRLKAIPEKSQLASAIENIDQLSREIAAELTRSGLGKRITYQGAPSYARVDGEELKKVVANLVQNALEASGEQGPVKIETTSENGSACIRVSDTGCGMTEEFLKNHLFKAFRTTKDKGLGIGLYQCRQIVEAHGGRLEAQSEVGKGSVFTVVLPAAKPEA